MKKWVDKIGGVVIKALVVLPLFFIVANYFTLLTSEERIQPIGWIFLIASAIYFTIALVLVIRRLKGA